MTMTIHRYAGRIGLVGGTRLGSRPNDERLAKVHLAHATPGILLRDLRETLGIDPPDGAVLTG